jgi:hypothetical protein
MLAGFFIEGELLSSSFCELLSKESFTCMCCIALEGETFPAALK